MRLSNDCESLRDYWNSQLGRAFLDQVFVAAEGRRGLEDAVRQVRQTFACASNADEAFYAVVIGRDILVVDRPIVSRAIETAGFEVVRRKTERLASPNVGSPSDETGAIPVKLLPSCHRVRLARQIGASQVGPELAAAELLLELSPFAEAAIPQLIRPNMFKVVSRRIDGPARFEQRNLQPLLSQHVSRNTACRSGTDNADVKGLRHELEKLTNLRTHHQSQNAKATVGLDRCGSRSLVQRI